MHPLSTAAFVNYLPTPLVLLTDSEGKQNVHIAPEAFSVASLEFADQIDAWQEAVNGTLKEVSSMLPSLCKTSSYAP